MENNGGISYRQILRLLLIAVGLAVALWVVHSMLEVLLVFFLALIIAIVLNAPVIWMETKRVPRPAGASAVLLLIVGIVAGLGYLVVPRFATEAGNLMTNLPTYAKQLGDFLARIFHSPSIAQSFTLKPGAAQTYIAGLLPRLGRYTLSLVPTIVILLFLVAISLYLVFSPHSVLRSYVESLPKKSRAPHMHAFARGSQLVVGWLWSNIILGVIQAIAAGIFLFAIGVPGALVWAVLALFAELVPVLGAYIMAVPPVIVAFTISPSKGVWVILFYIIFNILKDYLMVPLLRNVTMQLNPVYLLFATLAMTYLFGIIGAVVATPLAGFAKAYYDEFYLSRQREEPHIDEKVEAMVRRETVEAGLPGGPATPAGQTPQKATQTAIEQEKKSPDPVPKPPEAKPKDSKTERSKSPESKSGDSPKSRGSSKKRE